MATYTIGRSDDNSVVLSDTTVSRQHAELETRKRGVYVLRDLDSTYGTRIFRDGEWLNIIEVEVTDETEVTFGEYRTTIAEVVAEAAGSADAAPAAAAPVEAAPTPAAQPAAATPAPSAPSPVPASPDGSGMDKRMTMMILIGGGVLLAIVIAIVVVILLTGGSSPTDNRTAAATVRTAPPPSSPPTTGDRASFEALLVKGCTRRGAYNDTQCRCIAKHMSEALTREELSIYVALQAARGDSTKAAQIVQRYGATKVAAIGVKMAGMVSQVQQQCGVTLKRRQ